MHEPGELDVSMEFAIEEGLKYGDPCTSLSTALQDFPDFNFQELPVAAEEGRNDNPVPDGACSAGRAREDENPEPIIRPDLVRTSVESELVQFLPELLNLNSSLRSGRCENYPSGLHTLQEPLKHADMVGRVLDVLQNATPSTAAADPHHHAPVNYREGQAYAETLEMLVKDVWESYAVANGSLRFCVAAYAAFLQQLAGDLMDVANSCVGLLETGESNGAQTERSQSDLDSHFRGVDEQPSD